MRIADDPQYAKTVMLFVADKAADEVSAILRKYKVNRQDWARIAWLVNAQIEAWTEYRELRKACKPSKVIK
jgi:hypothetical protein